MGSPFTTFFKPLMSFIFNSKSIVFCPCSAYILLPELGVFEKSYVDVAYVLKEP